MASSPIFWLVALALVAGILAWIVTPLLRRTTSVDAPEDVSVTTAVYRDQKRQEERQHNGQNSPLCLNDPFPGPHRIKEQQQSRYHAGGSVNVYRGVNNTKCVNRSSADEHVVAFRS